MGNIVFPEDVGEVVLVDGVCYGKIVSTDLPVTHTVDDVDGVFGECSLCRGSSSSSSSNSSSNSLSSPSSSSSLSSSSDSSSSLSDSSSSPSSSSSGIFVPSLDCSGGTEPSMVLNVVGASGTITWCGLTWNLPGDSGLTQEVCPSQYIDDILTSGAYDKGYHRWLKNTGGGSLRLQRAVFDGVQRQNVIFLQGSPHTGDNTHNLWNYTGSKIVDNRGVCSLISTVASPTLGNYQLTNEFFGTCTQGGITYTWSKGTNW